MATLRLVALLLAAALAAPAAAQFSIDTVNYHGVSHAAHQNNASNLGPQGYRMASLAVAGGWANAHYSAVWVRQSGPAWVASHGMSLSQWTAQRAAWESQGYRAQILAASGSGTDRVFAAVFVQDGVPVVRRYGQSRSSFENDLENLNPAYRLTSCAIYGTAQAPLFETVYEPEGTNIGWGATISATADYNAHFAEYQGTDARPCWLAMNDTHTYVSAWRDDRIGAWSAVSHRTQAQFAADVAAFDAQGLFPISIAAGGSGSGARFSGVFASRLSPLPRTLTHTNPPSSIFMAPIDAWVDRFVQDNNVRNATLAVIRNGRLVHARGFSYAEAGHPPSPPDAPFRIGSISKAMTGMLVHEVMQSGAGGLGLGTAFPTYMGLPSTPGGQNVTLQSMLHHTSGMAQPNLSELDVALWVDPNNPRLPCSEAQICAWSMLQPVSSQGLYAYNNLGMTMPGQMIAQATGQSYLAALNARLGAPFGVTFRRQQARRSLLAPGEVSYYPTNLCLGVANLNIDLQPRAPAYNQRFWDAAGGLVTSAVDLARIVAGSFQIGDDSPVFGAGARGAMLAAYTVPAAGGGTAGVTDSAWHWSATSGGRTVFWHNGGQRGIATFCLFRTDGTGIVLFANTSVPIDGGALLATTDNVTAWPSADLFPSYGFPSFPRRPTLSSTVLGTLPNLTHGAYEFGGDQLDLITHVTFGGITLLPTLSTNWEDGYIERVSPTVLHVHPPQGLMPGTYGVQAHSPAGSSAIRNVTVTRAPTFAVGAQDYVIGGSMPFSVFAAHGALPSNSFVALGFSPSLIFSNAPGIVSLAIGNNFTELFVSDLRTFNPLTGTTRWDFPGLLGWQAIHLEAAALVPGSLNPLPVPTTAAVTVDRL
jgi:CubicO group peptidase (beta-lactamase class C family)